MNCCSVLLFNSDRVGDDCSPVLKIGQCCCCTKGTSAMNESRMTDDDCHCCCYSSNSLKRQRKRRRKQVHVMEMFLLLLVSYWSIFSVLFSSINTKTNSQIQQSQQIPTTTAAATEPLFHFIFVNAAERRPRQRQKHNNDKRKPNQRSTKPIDPNDYYGILGLKKNTATAKDIKKAYRKLALQYHPDKLSSTVSDDEKKYANDKFIQVSQAYSILSDDTKKQIYDQYGINGLQAYERGIDPSTAGFGSYNSNTDNGQGFGSFGGSGQTGGFNFGTGASAGGGAGGNANFHFNTDGFDPFVLFEQMFGNTGGGSGSTKQGRAGGGGGGGTFDFGGFPGGFQNFNSAASGGGGGSSNSAEGFFSQFGNQFGGQSQSGFGRRQGQPTKKQQQKQQQQKEPNEDIFSTTRISNNSNMKGVVSKLGSPKFPDSSSKYLWLIVFYSSKSKNNQMEQTIETLATKLRHGSSSSTSITNVSYKIGVIDCAMNVKEQQFCWNQIKKSASASTASSSSSSSASTLLDDLPIIGFVVDGVVTIMEDQQQQTSFPTAKEIHDFAVSNMPEKQLISNINHPTQVVKQLLDPNVVQFTMNKTNKKRIKSNTVSYVASVLLLTDKYDTSPMYISLGYKYRNNNNAIRFGQSKGKNLLLGKEFHVKKYPTLIMFVPTGYGDESYKQDDVSCDIIRYTANKSYTIDTISEWIDTIIIRLNQQQQSNDSTKRKTGTSSSSSSQQRHSRSSSSSNDSRRSRTSNYNNYYSSNVSDNDNQHHHHHHQSQGNEDKRNRPRPEQQWGRHPSHNYYGL